MWNPKSNFRAINDTRENPDILRYAWFVHTSGPQYSSHERIFSWDEYSYILRRKGNCAGHLSRRPRGESRIGVAVPWMPGGGGFGGEGWPSSTFGPFGGSKGDCHRANQGGFSLTRHASWIRACSSVCFWGWVKPWLNIRLVLGRQNSSKAGLGCSGFASRTCF